MFGDVNQPSIKIGNRKWYTVPVSLMSHAAIVLALVLIPILAPSAMPLPECMCIPTFMATPDPPKPPPAPPKHTDEKPTPPVDNGAPIKPPDGITPEPERITEPVGTPIDIILGGIETGPPEAPPVKIDKPAPDLPIRVGGLIRPPVKLAGQQPVYPPIAQSARVQGVVIIEATIGTDGHVMNAKLLRSIPLLDQAALDAVRTWSYSPTLLNGIPVAVIMTVTVQFSLQ
jgi:protein TonB